MDPIVREQVLTATRWALTTIGSIVVTKGWVDESTWALIAGAVLALAPLIWAILTKTLSAQIKHTAEIQDVKVIVGPNAPPAAKQLAADPAQLSVVPAPPP